MQSNTQLQEKPKINSVFSWILLFFLLLSFFGIYFGNQQIVDWWKLRNYVPSERITSIVESSTMTDYAKKLFYVNRPTLLTDRESFRKNCPVNVEKTIVLGCYIERDNGIHLFDVKDERLKGVIETTAAHEMLHAAYERLDGQERDIINGLLQEFYDTGLNDERVKKVIASYKTSDADIVNEMHSIFATEVPVLPESLEEYYKKYFKNRSQIIQIMQRYQNEFDSRENKVAAYDQELELMLSVIDSNRQQLDIYILELDRLQVAMNRYQQSDIEEYNKLVPTYNSVINRYNALLGQTRGLVERYNELVEGRNLLATEEQSLVRSLSGESLPEEQ